MTGWLLFRNVQAWPGLAYRVGEPAPVVGVVFLVAGVGLWGCGLVVG